MTEGPPDHARAGLVAEVVAALPHDLWRVRLAAARGDSGVIVTAGLGPAVRVLALRIRPGDRVRVELAAADPTRGTIVAREGDGGEGAQR